jgi:hypothetical protein
MEKFITFNTTSQAKNYVKRYKSYTHNDGCGCCYHFVEARIIRDRVMRVHGGSSQGEYFTNYMIIGKIKKTAKL